MTHTDTVPDYIQPAEEAAPQTLEKLKGKIAEARDINFEIVALEERLKEANSKLNKLLTKELPEILGDAGVNRLDIEADGNLPAMEAKVETFYRANIAASWDIEKRLKAFATLAECGGDSLIKAEISIRFPMNQYNEAHALYEQFRKQKLDAEITQSVHSGTLSAWLKEELLAGRHVPLDEIGGHVGRVVKLIPKEAKNGKAKRRNS